MNKQEAITILQSKMDGSIDTSYEWCEAIRMAIEALQGDLHCPKCGTIVRGGKQYHDLVYRGESQTTHDKMESQGERMTRIVYELCGWDKDDAESATTTDCISRQQAIEEIKTAGTITGWNKYASQEEIVDDVERQLRRLFVGAIESLPPVIPTDEAVDFNNMISAGGRIRNHPLAINAVEKPDITTTEQGRSPCNTCRYSDRFWDEYPCYDCIAGFRRYEPVEQQKNGVKEGE